MGEGDKAASQKGALRAPGPRGDARREAILDAAWALFMERGFERTTLSDIIARSGGSRTTLYEAFGDKTGLFESAVSIKCRQFTEQLREISLNYDDPRQALTEFGLHFAQELLTTDSAKIMRLLIANSEQFPRVIDTFQRGGPDSVQGILSDYLRAATERGQLRVKDPDRAATTFLGFLHGEHYLKILLRPEEAPARDEVRRLVEDTVGLFLDGVR
ncbi:TetR/AcrR family transcriptional regulator [Azospirillum sp. SYSU D00513]|uniref:TetR/AcrR family transcriptional regulator n=1 Tax=Azospirillum sp. SYSU D00513 TaxID=2812561 RepID=UPI001A974BB7|nr:TetR/AcrR family transcriptional regulator [Azospirillum sp. SYSU D00513]